MFLVDRKGNYIPYIGSYHYLSSIIYRRPGRFVVDYLTNLDETWNGGRHWHGLKCPLSPFRMGDPPSRLTDFGGKNDHFGAFSFDNLVVFRPISMKLEMWVDNNID